MDTGLVTCYGHDVKIPVKNEHSDRWLAFFEGKWRRVNILVSKTYINYRGYKLTIKIDGL